MYIASGKPNNYSNRIRSSYIRPLTLGTPIVIRAAEGYRLSVRAYKLNGEFVDNPVGTSTKDTMVELDWGKISKLPSFDGLNDIQYRIVASVSGDMDILPEEGMNYSAEQLVSFAVERVAMLTGNYGEQQEISTLSLDDEHEIADDEQMTE